jgi:hypothetical protein
VRKNSKRSVTVSPAGLLLLAIFVSLSSVDTAIAIQQRSEDIFSSMQTTVTALQNSSKSLNSSAKEELEIITAAIKDLERVSKANPVTARHPAYREALEMDAKLLQSLLNEEKSEVIVSKLSEVRSSLVLKVRFATSSKGSSLRLIQLIVKTMQGQREVGEYEVWYVPRGWADVADKYRRFDDLSSPAIKDLPAGNYLIWLQVTSKIVTERVPVTLGEDGKSKRRVTLSVP